MTTTTSEGEGVRLPRIRKLTSNATIPSSPISANSIGRHARVMGKRSCEEKSEAIRGLLNKVGVKATFTSNNTKGRNIPD